MSLDIIFPCRACALVTARPVVRHEASYCPACGARVFPDVAERERAEVER